MQLQVESRPALTGPGIVDHSDVLLPPADVTISAPASTESSEQSRQRRDVLGEAAFLQDAPTAPHQRTVPALDDAALNKSRVNVRRTASSLAPIDELYAAPIEMWEGEVKSVDATLKTMHVYLRSKIGHTADHSAEIDLEYVAEQDKDLVRPGAVFYWTIFKTTNTGSVWNSQELRFRRRPNWSQAQLDRLKSEASSLFQSPKAPRVLDEPGA